MDDELRASIERVDLSKVGLAVASPDAMGGIDLVECTEPDAVFEELAKHTDAAVVVCVPLDDYNHQRQLLSASVGRLREFWDGDDSSELGQIIQQSLKLLTPHGWASVDA